MAVLERRKNYRKYIKNLDTEYFDLKYALFSLNEFEDGVYHILGENHTFKGRIHHLIALKYEDYFNIFDYAGAGGYSFGFLKMIANLCVVTEKKFKITAMRV